ncbi:glucokinase [Paracraurococcus ruber]|uniref:Glucokinase n=1 Tax=Paracraurococcus ruber TaxID=77675 RepID=A0ABS1D3M8_9PROT|nr:glucokinase [Paracraurococcus ruber]MBK1661098.1 glucokinase [Paracraurococcus ruber]TDG25716.1 glucokinase [Paracraurococcus ruber]
MTTLLADIGGTNARFALLDGEAHTPPVNLPLSGFTGIAAAIASFLADRPAPAAAVLAVAGPVQGNRVTLTNRGWVVDGAEIAAALGIRQVRVVNDFAALSWSLPALAGADLHPLGGGAAEAGEAMAVLGPGTGLGVGAFLPPGRVLVTEGGHASLAAHDAREAAVVEWLRARHGHVSAERLLSGQGIENIHAALTALGDGGTAPLDAAAVAARGLANEDPACRETMDMFCALLGGVAGDLALLYGAKGGVFVAGGICPRFPEFLAASRFRARFEAKGRFKTWLAPIPTWLILRPDAAMLGLATLARQG